MYLDHDHMFSTQTLPEPMETTDLHERLLLSHLFVGSIKFPWQ